MISSNSHKFLFIAFFALLLTASCSFFQTETDKNDSEKSESEIQTNIPFSTKTPQTFQTEIIVTTYIADKKIEKSTFKAKDNDKQLLTFDYKGENSRSSLNLENTTFLIDHQSKTYRKISSEKANTFSDDSLIKSLTSRLLNQKKSSQFTKLEEKDGIISYRVDSADSKESETIVYVDTKVGIPIKQELYKLSDGERNKAFSVELKNFKTEVDESLFKLPEDYKEIG